MLHNFVIKTFLDKRKFDKYSKYINYDNIDTNYKYIYNIINNYYTESDSDITIDTIKLLIKSEYPSMKEDKYQILIEILNSINALEIDSDAEELVLRNLITQQFAISIGDKSVDIVDNPTIGMEEIHGLLAEYDTLLNNTTRSIDDDVEYTLEELLEANSDESGIKWWCDQLQMSLGSMKPATLGCIFAPPDAGKTAFILTTLLEAAKQTTVEEPVIHINNEESDKKLLLRAWCCLNECDETWLRANKGKAKANWATIQGKYVLKDVPSITFREIEHIIRTRRPKLLVIDQVSKIKLPRSDRREDVAIQDAWMLLRELAKRYDCHIIGVHQADASAFGKDYLTMDAVRSSKIGLQAEVDYMIGINPETDDLTQESIRYISFPKNKPTGRNSDRWIFEINKARSRYYV